MRILRFSISLSLALHMVSSVLPASPTFASSVCSALPSSSLRLYDIKTVAVEEVLVPAAALDAAAIPDERLVSRHTMMLTSVDLAALSQITHRIIPQSDGTFCDAPSLVSLGFGISRRVAYLARDAAADACVRAAMLDHEAAHTKLLEETIDRFIDRQGDSLQRGMLALKQMPAPTASLAQVRWEAGVQFLTTDARRQLRDELRAAIARADDALSLAALEDSCDGKLRLLQEHERAL